MMLVAGVFDLMVLYATISKVSENDQLSKGVPTSIFSMQSLRSIPSVSLCIRAFIFSWIGAVIKGLGQSVKL